MNNKSLFVDRSGLIRPDLIPLAAFLCAEEYGTYARSIILDHAAAGAPLADLTVPTPDGWVVLEPIDLAAAEEALRRGGPAPRVSPVDSGQCSVVSGKNGRTARAGRRPSATDNGEAQPGLNGTAPPPVPSSTDHYPLTTDHCEAQPSPNGQPMKLAELVDHEALAYRAWGTPTGDFLARQMDRLAQLVRWTGATSPEEHDDRMETWDEQLREEWERRGYDAGYAAGRREGRRLAFDEVLLVLKRS
jgi:hypothetical protein